MCVLCYITDLIEGLFLLFATESVRFASIKKKKIIEDFPGGSVVETLSFHAGGIGSTPGWRSSTYHAVWGVRGKIDRISDLWGRGASQVAQG